MPLAIDRYPDARWQFGLGCAPQRYIQTAVKDARTEHWVIVLGWLTIGGAERQALYLARALLKERGARVTVIGMSNPGYVMDECRQLGVDCRFWRYEFPVRFWTQIGSILRFAARLRSLQPTYIAPYCMPANLICGLTWRLTGAKSCVWQQRDEGRMRRHDWIEALAVRLTPAFISNSEHAARWLEVRMRVNHSDIRVIRNGVRIPTADSQEASWREQWTIPKEKKILSMVANLHSYKDHMTLIRAWQVVKRSPVSLGWLLVLAGRHQDAYPLVQKFVVDNELTESVLLTEGISDVPALLNATDLLVFSSLHEGVPNGILEGMAHGLAVVATDIPGIREALGETSPEQLAAHSDPEQFAEKIIFLMMNPQVRQALGQRNRERVISLFAEDAMVRNTTGVFLSSGSGLRRRHWFCAAGRAGAARRITAAADSGCAATPAAMRIDRSGLGSRRRLSGPGIESEEMRETSSTVGQNRLTIVIPGFRSEYLRDTLESLRLQTCQDFDVLVADDASPDDLDSVVKSIAPGLNLRYVRFAINLGSRNVTAHWDRAVRLTDSPWALLLGDDDCLDPEVVERFIAALAETQERFDLYRFNTRRIDSRGLVCVFHANWTAVPLQTGHLFRRKLDGCSKPNWTVGAKRRAGVMLFTL